MSMPDEKQQRLIKSFFQQEKIWWPDYHSYGFAARILLVITAWMYLVPFQFWDSDYQAPCWFLILELEGFELYLRQYVTYREDGKVKSVYGTIRFLPVAQEQFVLYVLKKLLKACLWMTGMAVVCQVVFAILFLHTCSFGNLLIPFICCLVLPMLLLGSTLWWRKW